MTDSGRKTVLVLGATGMLGHAVLRDFAADERFQVYGSVRSDRLLRSLSVPVRDRIVGNVNVEDIVSLLRLFDRVKPDVVVNCIGLVKQLTDSNDPLLAVPINTILPHRLARLCAVASARLVHVSTDCIFDGKKKGGYVETDPADAQDLYGRSKHMGEVDYANAITLRTSIIGPELGSAVGLLGWFLKSEGRVSGFNRAVFSGFPTVELSNIIRNYVVPRSSMRGVYHVAATPINKYDLLSLVARVYEKRIEIAPDGKLVIDRSLNADRFNAETGYRPPDWMSLIKKMHAFG